MNTGELHVQRPDRPGRRPSQQKQDRLDRWRRRGMDVPAALVCVRRIQFPRFRHEQLVGHSLWRRLYSQRQSRPAERARGPELQVLELRRANRRFVASIKAKPRAKPARGFFVAGLDTPRKRNFRDYQTLIRPKRRRNAVLPI